MKKLLLPALIVTALCGLMATPAHAAKDKKKNKGAVESPLAKFDTNLDGTLDSTELAEIETALAALKNLDKNGDGKLDDAERTAAQEALKAQPAKKKKKKKDL